MNPASAAPADHDPDTPKRPHDAEALRRVAEAFGTPTYVYFEEVLRDRCRRLRAALPALPVRWLYAMKANASPALLRIIAEEGFGFDAVSPGEVALLEALGIAPDRIQFSSTSLRLDELEAVARQGVWIDLDDVDRLAAFGELFPGHAVSLRINPGQGAGHHRHVVTAGKEAKFGIPPEDLAAAREVAARTGLRVVGLHQHIGSGILQTEALLPAMEVLMEAASAFPDLAFLNFGGGFGIPYRADQPGLAIETFAPVLGERLRRFHADRGQVLETWFEPGRYVVAECGVLLTQVQTLKTTSDRVFAGTDSGFNHLLRPALYGAYHALYNCSNPDAPLRLYDVVGNICESGDLFARQRLVQTLRPGDLLAVLDTGAYGMSMASTYNLRGLPAEVLVTPDGDLRCIRPRQTAHEVVAAMLHLEGYRL